MKKFSFLMLAMAGMLFAACSSDKDAVDGGLNNSSNALPEGYMSLTIKLPTNPVMRAANDVFDDGTANEYRVLDCAILLFQGDSGDEGDAMLMNAQQVMLPDGTEDLDDDNITVSYQAVAKVDGYDIGNDLYALAMVNYKNIMSIDANGVPTIAGTQFNGNLNALREIVTSATMVPATLTTRSGSTNYFFMTNAVLSKAAGGTGATSAPDADDIIQLAEMNPDEIYATAAEAKDHPAGEILVERAVAKATLSVSATKVMDMDIASTEWAIDNMEPTSYVVRNPGLEAVDDYIGYSSEAFGTDYNYRFVSHTSTAAHAGKGTTEDFYRTYWCIDPQYRTDAYTPTTTMVAASAFIATGTTPLYCFENTFDVARQKYGNTTRAIIKVTLGSTADIYAINGQMYTKANAETYIIDNIVNNSDVLTAFQNGLKAGKSYTVTPASFAITYERDAATGQYKVKTLGLSAAVTAMIDETTDDSDDSKIFKHDFDPSTVLTAAIATANTAVVVLQYKDGEMWYEARFQHFAYTADESVAGGLSLAPWNSWEVDPDKPTSGDVDHAYPYLSEENYLGRYGMVRNNWYDVEVTAFNKLGSPVDPSGKVEKPDTPDDNLDQYISAKIHVLSWAKRTQSWSF